MNEKSVNIPLKILENNYLYYDPFIEKKSKEFQLIENFEEIAFALQTIVNSEKFSEEFSKRYLFIYSSAFNHG